MAEVTFTNELFHSDELIVVPILQELQENVLNANSKDSNEKKEEKVKILTNLDEVSQKKYQGNQLIASLNEWAEPIGFKLVFSEGKKKLNEGYKRVIRCNNKECCFQMIFMDPHSQKDQNYEPIDQILQYELKEYCNEHNHPLNYKAKSQFSKQILDEIDLLKGQIKTLVYLQNVINTKFGTNFTYAQIQYQVNHLLEQNFGHPTEDATNFVEEMRKDVAQNDGHFSFELGDDGKLEKALFISAAMLM